MFGVLGVLWWLLLVTLGLVLLARLRRSRNVGFLLLFIAIALWPLLTWSVTFLIQVNGAVDNYQTVEPPFFLLGWAGNQIEVARSIQYLQAILRMTLLLVGFLLLGRARNEAANEPPNSALQPTGRAGG